MRQLLIRPGAIGDCILSLPVLHYLTEKFSPGETEVWVPTPVVPLVQLAHLGAAQIRSHALSSTGLDLLGLGDIPTPERLVHRLQTFDSIVSWYGAARPDFRSATAALCLPFTFHAALPCPGANGHTTDFFARQVDAPAGLVTRLDLPPAPRRDAIVIHPFSGSSKKNWPLAKFRELALQLPLPIEWCAGPEESLPNAHRFDDLWELACWLKGARLYIGNDSGIGHLAAATGVPALLLFGPTDPAVWAPRGNNVRAMRWEPLQDLESTALLPEILQLLR